MLGSSKARAALLVIGTALFSAPAFAGDPIGVLYPANAGDMPGGASGSEKEPPPPCTEDCFLLSSLVLSGSVKGQMSFELKGSIRAPRESIKVPLFGPPGQVRLDDVTIDGAPAPIAFDGDKYSVFSSARAFTVRGRITLGSDQMLAVPGPIVSIDAHLTNGRLIEGDKLSGITGAVLHFDPMIDGVAKEDGDEEGVGGAKGGAGRSSKTASLFRVARALRFGRETTFVYRITASQGTDLGTIRFPLRYAEKVSDVQGATGWSVEGTELLLPASGHEAEITVSGSLASGAAAAAAATPKTYSPDSRSAYEWWLIEADPEHRVAAGGEPKLVETSQSPIPPMYPGARVYLVQKNQQLEVEARSLVRGDVLAAVARTHKRWVAITGRNELISDETIGYDNNGLDHLMVTPAGKAMYLSTDANAQRILHTEAGAKDVLVPVRAGTHALRVQSLSEARVWPLAGVISIPSTTYPLATSTAETTIGLPENVHPLAVLGGDRSRWSLGRGDLIAVVLGIALACFGFRERKTRAIASVVTAGLWFVSKEGFVIATSGLFLAGAVFLASRFLRGTWLLLAGGVLTVVALLGGRFALSSDATVEPTREMFVEKPELPHPEAPGGSLPTGLGGGDSKTDITPVSLSFPTSERYVQASRQLVTNERPFVPRVVYITSTLIGALHIVWLALVGLLIWAHKDRLAGLKAKIIERLRRRPTAPDPTLATEEAPF